MKSCDGDPPHFSFVIHDESGAGDGEGIFTTGSMNRRHYSAC